MSKIVLCVDDSATMQQVADITFRGTEFTYVGARSFDEGLDKAKSQKPAIVLADSHMPGNGKSGYDLCLALKSEPATSNIPVVILIGNAAPYDTARGLQVGADANLPKPWDTQTMLEKVTEIVGKAASGVARPGQAAGAAAAPPATTAAPPAAVPASAAKSAPAPAAAAASAAMPPRSATIMGMPTIKMPGNAQPTPPPPPVVPTKTSVIAVPPISPTASAGASPSIRSPAPPVAAPAAAVAPPVAAPAAPAAAVAPPVAASAASVAPAASPAPPAPSALAAMSRAPMVSGTPTKRSLLVERTLAKMAAQLAEIAGLEPGSPELTALLKLSTEVVERIVWEVVPELAEQIIRENLHDLTARRS